jgi:hypothetical protein
MVKISVLKTETAGQTGNQTPNRSGQHVGSAIYAGELVKFWLDQHEPKRFDSKPIKPRLNFQK